MTGLRVRLPNWNDEMLRGENTVRSGAQPRVRLDFGMPVSVRNARVAASKAVMDEIIATIGRIAMADVRGISGTPGQVLLGTIDRLGHLIAKVNVGQAVGPIALRVPMATVLHGRLAAGDHLDPQVIVDRVLIAPARFQVDFRTVQTLEPAHGVHASHPVATKNDQVRAALQLDVPELTSASVANVPPPGARLDLPVENVQPLMRIALIA